MTVMESEIITDSSVPEKSQAGVTLVPENTVTSATHKSELESHELEGDALGTRRIYKKTSPNSLVTLYLGSREIVSSRGVVSPLRGVLFVDPKYVLGHRLFCQLTLTFRYGREDEEVMGLKFCNEAIIALTQIWPHNEESAVANAELTPLQDALLQRLGVGAHAFTLEVGVVAPPSVQLIPAKHYSGAPIGTSYDIRAYIADQADEKVQRRSTVKLGIRLIHRIPPEVRCLQTVTNVSSLPKCLRLRMSPKAIKFSNKLCGGGAGKTGAPRLTDDKPDNNGGTSGSEDLLEEQQRRGQGNCSTTEHLPSPPQGFVDKPFLWTDGKVSLWAALNKTAYGHAEKVCITVNVHNNSRKTIRKIRVCAVQHVDVCMFSNGKFKNVVAEESVVEPPPQLGPGTHFHRTFELLPVRTPTKNWIAVEGALFNSSFAAAASESANEHRLAPSSPSELKVSEDRNVFAIYVSYYVKIKLTLGGMGGEVSLKLPFLLGEMGSCDAGESGSGSAGAGSDTAGVKGDNNEIDSDCLHKVSSLVVPQSVHECEIISEICEMSLSNLVDNNVNNTERDANGTDDNTVDKVDKDGNTNQQVGVKVAADEDDDDEENHLVPVVTSVQVHASNDRIGLGADIDPK